MKVPFFRYPHVFERDRTSLTAAFERVASEGAFILQPELRKFEERVASYVGATDAIGVGNATDGLEMIVREAGVGPDDEVILPSHTFVATASAVVAAGAQPVFAEIGPDHLLDPGDVERRVTSRTRALLVTHLNGRVADMDRLVDIARRHELTLLEDSAQAIGARFRGRMAGTFGGGGVLSFYPAKVLGGLGDGGVILTMDAEAALHFRRIRDHGRDPETGEVLHWGRNSRLDTLQAAFLSVKLDHLDEEIALRRSLASRYHRNLSDVEELRLPPPPVEDGERFDTYLNYEVEAEDRDALRAYLAVRGIGTIIQWGGKGVHQHMALGFTCTLPVTERMFERALMLPLNASVSEDEVDYVCESVRAFYHASP